MGPPPLPAGRPCPAGGPARERALNVETLAAGDLAEAEALLARAFLDTPLCRAVVGGDDARRLRCNAAGMHAFLPPARRVAHALVAREGRALAAALVGAPPGLPGWPPPSLGATLRLLVQQGPRVIRRWSEVSLQLVALRPAEPHHYLATLGVEPALQGRGLGTALLAAWLRRVDAAGTSAYVETDSRRALALYERAGFAPVGECELFGVRVWRMLRTARGDGEVELETSGPVPGARRRA